MQPRIAIVGAGNWLLLNDRIGPRVVASLERRYGPQVELHNVGTTSLGLLDCLDAQDLMVVIDACIAGLPPGTVQVVEPDLDQVRLGGETSSHQLGPVETLALARKLFPEQLPKRTVFVLVETEDLTEEEESTASVGVLAQLDRLVATALSNNDVQAHSGMVPHGT